MSDESRSTAFVRVKVEVEVIVSSYGGEWTLDDIRKQAHRQAPIAVTNALNVSSGIRVIGVSSSDVVIRTEERR